MFYIDLSVIFCIVSDFQEVFKSDFYEAATFSRVLGKCFVMPVKDYYKMKPEVGNRANLKLLLL